MKKSRRTAPAPSEGSNPSAVWPLLTDPSPCLRLRILLELVPEPDEQEVAELFEARGQDSLLRQILRHQEQDGGWPGKDRQRATTVSLLRLSHLGLGREHPAVARGTEYLFSLQKKDGSWSLPRDREDEGGGGYDLVPLQTAIPLRAVASCGYAEDARAERAYDWLLARRLEDGAWPTGKASGTLGFVAGYRRLPHSRWGCRSNTTGALACLSLHPKRRTDEPARRALDLLLGRETKERHTLGFEVARLVSAEPYQGFFTFYARYDIAFVLNFCWRLGATREDPRVDELVRFVESARGAYSLWKYEARPQATNWISFDLLQSLSRIDAAGDWLSFVPRTPFRPYTKELARY
jgi:hypothetical protein